MVLVYRGSVAYLSSEPGVDSTAIWQTRPAAGGKDYGNRGVGGEGGEQPLLCSKANVYGVLRFTSRATRNSSAPPPLATRVAPASHSSVAAVALVAPTWLPVFPAVP
ncbi:hypothetical protein [Rothia sp. HMSC069C03]|uniref:hypothetical protein n=1 Tax=Rothia sp. HMSC069C03 TaxID=1739283 RepID=UPI0018F89360|nr:hypothetical protein [Rothia sp. HMSC069C03]